MSNLNDPHELEREAAEITLPEGRDGGVDRPEPPALRHGPSPMASRNDL